MGSLLHKAKIIKIEYLGNSVMVKQNVLSLSQISNHLGLVFSFSANFGTLIVKFKQFYNLPLEAIC